MICPLLNELLMDSKFLNFTTLVVSIAGFWVAYIALNISRNSMTIAQKAFSLSSFNNRYKFYCQLKKIFSEIENNSTGNFSHQFHQVELLIPKAKYLFNDDIGNLLESIKELILKASQSGGFIGSAKAKNLKISLKKISLESYFDIYLSNSDLRRP